MMHQKVAVRCGQACRPRHEPGKTADRFPILLTGGALPACLPLPTHAMRCGLQQLASFGRPGGLGRGTTFRYSLVANVLLLLLLPPASSAAALAYEQHLMVGRWVGGCWLPTPSLLHACLPAWGRTISSSGRPRRGFHNVASGV